MITLKQMEKNLNRRIKRKKLKFAAFKKHPIRIYFLFNKMN